MSPSRRERFGTRAAAALLALSACTSGAAFEYGDGDLEGHYFTYPRATGNRVIDSSIKGTFPSNIQTYDVNLPSNVTWAVASHHPQAGFKYVVTTAENKAYVIHPSTKQGMPATMEELVDFQAGGDQPPLVRHKGLNELPVIVTLPKAAKVAPLSHPVPAGEDVYAFIDTAGDLVLWNLPNNTEIGRLSGVNALPDGRIVRSINGHLRPWLAFYGGVEVYPSSCLLGDCIEGIFADVQLPEGDVYEGISPMFLPDDTVVATVSNPERGSMMVKYNWEGDEVSSSPAMGWNGWRHQLFYNDFGTSANPLPYFVDLYGPHSDQRKEMQFASISSPVWSVDKTIGQYNTQKGGTRYLDTNVSGDLNGDGIAEAVVPSRYRAKIVSVQIDTGSGEAKEMWSLNMPKKMSSNLAAVGGNAGIALGAASGNTFRMWMPTLDVADTSSKDPGKQMTEEQQLEDLLREVKYEEKEVSGLLIALIISFFAVAVVLVAYRLKKRRASRKEMGTLIHDPNSGRTNISASSFASSARSSRTPNNFGFNASAHNDGMVLDACPPDDSMWDDDDDEDGAVFDVQLDRDEPPQVTFV
eukprot:CAMPEP_0181071288 /NCGR_PEP_ID=MMETSP1070-20121207/27943_1 /TAXON_ID=265543 /ORGANISM="Minutocellus polymorphus, Strain NH13" /LENGTH=581 /DNA_ID=CAMNT_0023152237 /DNA_START=136 /DNA_END=1881 /DNA_ORIENTATION=-